MNLDIDDVVIDDDTPLATSFCLGKCNNCDQVHLFLLDKDQKAMAQIALSDEAVRVLIEGLQMNFEELEQKNIQ